MVHSNMSNGNYQVAEAHSFGLEPITCHAWNKDRTEIAFSLNSNDVIICKNHNGHWSTIATLSAHDLRVTSIDWAPNTNRIVTCGADRNAYVWTLSNGLWTKSLVLLRINRAAMCVKWSPKENKFAVGCGAKLVAVCYFDEENDWWLSKHIKKPIRSTVTSIDWHPNNYLLAVGATDFTTRVFSAYIKEVDDKPSPSSWGDKTTFANMLSEYSRSGGWTHDVRFSPSGDKLAWVSHDSSISVVDSKRDVNNAVTQRTMFLPFMACIWLRENHILAAGHDCCPMLYKYDQSGKLAFEMKVDQVQKRETGGFSALKKFADMDKRATSENVDVLLDTTHQNTITQLSMASSNKNDTTICSTGMDGLMVIWDVRVK
ncbi:actin-related protein 2/3 complex subunit 1A-B-like [Paramacrobiotus metropolitanus]|uniref:actin-related protein 2/3 complex subunit 1A-B-like n=1 Tax=Paramacrobiotus metropolitanus TaxID=2943436 RepID=UPI00244560C5|nr:actin-related protein 2/3 complex subunit 1A-B-like [Paramacrobiotus metropolitanus]